MIGQPSNQLIADEEQQIQAAVSPQYRDVLTQVLQLGMKWIYAPAQNKSLQNMINKTSDPSLQGSIFGITMMNMLQEMSGKKLPQQILVPGVIMFAMEYLDLVAKVGKVQITPQLIAHTVQHVGSGIMKMLKITPQKMHEAIGAGKQKIEQSKNQNIHNSPVVHAAHKGILASQMGAQ
jgi:hypothetical protein